MQSSWNMNDHLKLGKMRLMQKRYYSDKKTSLQSEYANTLIHCV